MTLLKLVLSKIRIQSLSLFLRIQTSLQSKLILAQEIWTSVSFHLDTATLKLLAGELTLTNTTLNSGTVNITSGDAEIENSNLANIAFSITTGDLDLENSQASDTTFELSMGDFSANAATFKNDNTITMTTGEVDITLVSKDLKVVMTNLLGDADITSNLNQSSKNTLTIDGNVGDITIQ